MASVKVSAQAGDLARALAMISLGVSKRNANISAVHIAAASGAVELASSFLELSISARAIATIAEPGNAAVAALPLINLITSLPPGAPVTISATETWVSIVCNNHRSRLALMPWEQEQLSSMIDVADEIGCIMVTGAEALVLLEPLPAAESERTRFYLGGVHWRTDGDKLTACGTDGVRLILTYIAAGTFSEGLILPREGAAVLQKLIKNTKPDVLSLRCSKRLLAATSASFSSVSKLIDAKYPDISPVIPPPSRNAVTCKRDPLVEALRSLDAVACMTDKAPFLLLRFDGEQKLHIGLAREPENGFDIVEAETTGVGRAVVQLRLMLEMLGHLSGEKVRLEFNSGRPLRMFGAGDKLALLAQIQWNFETEERRAAAR